MIAEQDLKKIIEQVLVEMGGSASTSTSTTPTAAAPVPTSVVEEGCIPDITEVDIRKQLLVENPFNKEGFLEMKSYTPSRVGLGRAGTRFKTETILRFRADHAAAQDAAFSYVPEEVLTDLGVFSVQSQCVDKDEYLTRPDLGRKLSQEAVQTILEKCPKNPRVQIVLSDGLSSSAIVANAKNTLRSLTQGLKGYGIDPGTPFFVKLGRVGVMDHVSEVTGAEVTVILIGERPGLVTAESMSAYMAYKAKIDMPESNRTVLSNIHNQGTVAVEAGAHIADVVKEMLDKKASGLDLKK